MSRHTFATHRRSRAASASGTRCLLLAGLAGLAGLPGLALAGCSSSSSPASSSAGSGASAPSTATATASTTHSAAPPGTASPAAASSSPGNTGSGASVPFPVAVGNTWKYATTAVGESATTTNKMTAVVPVANGQQVTMTSTSTLLGTNTSTNSTYIFGSDGSITYPLTQLSSTSGVSISGSGVVWPPASEIDSGQPSTSDLKMSIKASGQTISTTAHITVQGAGTATVTVPAGTYQATIVDMTISITVEGVAVNEQIKTWLASGVGPVKDEVLLDEAGTDHVTASEELESFTKG